MTKASDTPGKYYTTSHISVKQGIVPRQLDESVSVLIMDIDGMEYEYPWKEDMRMHPFLVEPLLDEIGIPEMPLRVALRSYCLKLVQTYGADGITIEKLRDYIEAFEEGWDCRPKG